MKNNTVKRIMTKVAAFAAVVMIGAMGSSMTTEAAMGNGRFVPIDGGVVDSITVNGKTVNAIYTSRFYGYDWDDTYCCAAFVHRFYSEVYGRNVYNLNSVSSVPMIDQGSFQVTTTPKVGDILRDNQSVHWAIVKEVQGDKVTLIQQNAWNNAYDKAWVGATAELGDSRYTYFTWTGNAGGSQQTNQNTMHDISFEYQPVTAQETNAEIRTKVNNPERLHVQKVGCHIFDSEGKEIKVHEESCSRPESRFNVWYDLAGELGMTLEPGTQYSYQFYVLYDGVHYYGPKMNFTTSGTAKKEKSGLISKEIQKELSNKCGKEPKLKYAKYAWMDLEDMLEKDAQIVDERMGDVAKEKNGVSYYSREKCGIFSTEAPTAYTYKNGKVDSVTWKYTYKDDSRTEKSKKFYEGVAKKGDKVLKEGGVGICKSKDQMTTTWGDHAELEWAMIDGRPTVTLTLNVGE